MGKYFRHSLGHGVGLDIHEGYNASPKSNDTFEVGNITSIEPGIYIPDKFGIRIEDLLYIFIILSNRYFCASRLGVLYGMYG